MKGSHAFLTFRATGRPDLVFRGKCRLLVRCTAWLALSFHYGVGQSSERGLE